MEPNPYYFAWDSKHPDPCGHKHRTFAGAASCAVFRDNPQVATGYRERNGPFRIVDIRERNDVPAGQSDEMVIVKVYNNRRMAYFRDNSGDAERAVLITELEPGETELLSVDSRLRAPWNFKFGEWYSLREAAAHNHVAYINLDGVDGEAPGLYVDGVLTRTLGAG